MQCFYTCASCLSSPPSFSLDTDLNSKVNLLTSLPCKYPQLSHVLLSLMQLSPTGGCCTRQLRAAREDTPQGPIFREIHKHRLPMGAGRQTQPLLPQSHAQLMCVSQGCCDKTLHTGGIKTTEIYSLTVQRMMD